ncbi:MAG: WD40 repeat domain-containing serine/threonine protein kinase [Verrucomicrobiota bacterium]
MMIADRPTDISGSSRGDDYEIGEVIGRGGGGTIYQAFEIPADRTVAIKLLNTGRIQEEESRLRFRAEIRAVAKLDHPNIVPVYASGDLDGQPFFTMKYIPGGGLDSQLPDYADPLAAVNLMAQIAHAIHHAHERGVLHRDLKPSNILLDKEGIPYVSDFGLAKMEDDSLGLTQTGSIMGTPNYMSPEQAKGTEVTTTSDIFSLGSILFRLLAGREVFAGDSTHSVIRNVIETDANFTRDEEQALDKDLTTISLKCLQKDPELRYPSALALADDLERWKRGEAVAARPIPWNEKARRWIKRNPALAAAAALAALAILVGTAISIGQWRNAVAERKVAEENAYYATVANALAAREDFDYGETHRLLEKIPKQYRGFEWELVNGLSRADYEWSIDFGGAIPIDMAFDAANGQIIVLTDNRLLQFIDPEKHEIIEKVELPLPQTFLTHPLFKKSYDQVNHPTVPADVVVKDYLEGVSGLRFLSISPDGQHYAYLDGMLLVVAKHPSGEPIHLGWVSNARPIWLDSDTLLAGGEADPIAGHRAHTTIHQLSTGKTTHLPQTLTAPLACTTDGQTLAMVRNDREALVFQRKDRFHEKPPLQVFSRMQGTITQLQLSSDGTHLAAVWSTSRQSELSVFEVASGEEVFTQTIPARPRIAFWPDSLVLGVSGRETWFSSWDTGQPGDSKAVSGAPQPGYGIPLADRILQSRELPLFHLGHRAPVEAMLPNGDGSGSLLTASSDGQLHCWNRGKSGMTRLRKTPVRTSLEQHHPIASPNGKHVIYVHRGTGDLILNTEGRSDPTESGDELRVWHRESGLESVLPANHTHVGIFDDGRALSFRYPRTTENVDDPDFRFRDYICWQTRPGQAPEEVWRIKDCSLPWGFPITQSAQTPDGGVAALYPGSAHLFDLRNLPNQKGSHYHREPLHRERFFPIRSGKVPGRTIALSPDFKFVALTGSYKTVQVYDIALSYSPTNPSTEPRLHLASALGLHQEGMNIGNAAHEDPIRDSACVFDQDNSRLFVGNENGWIHVLDVKNDFTLIPEEGWQAHSDAITAMAVSQSGEIIATASGGSLILWSTEKRPGEPRRNRLHLNTGEQPRNWIQFCADDTVLFHSSAEGVIEAWETAAE